MATSSAATAVTSAGPSSTQLLFARSVIYTFDLWPALRLAISEQWGGAESKAKADYLISYLCDEFSVEKGDSSGGGGGGGNDGEKYNLPVAPQTPDVDDLAEILEGYFADEFESRLEDESADLIAARLVQFHKLVYATFPPTNESLSIATEEVNKMEQHAIAIRGKKVVTQTTQESEEDSSSEDESGESGEEDAMDVDSAPKSRAEPIVDEDGFTTVVKGKRR
ncbi:hypothetical protein CBS101457_002021 [Exobasidium rhododendri]|nr:hypothetical protein CBS101457_002021 [Exobasidium rhododendri]